MDKIEKSLLTGIVLIAILCLISVFVNAGSITGLENSDCTDQIPICVATEEVCTHYHNGICLIPTLAYCVGYPDIHSESACTNHPRHAVWHSEGCDLYQQICMSHMHNCIAWEDVCTNSIDTIISGEADITADDSDMVDGMHYNPQWAVDRSGIGIDAVNRMLNGDGDIDFLTLNGGYNGFMLSQVNSLLSDQNDYLLAMFRLGHDADPIALEHEAARIKAGRIGKDVWTSDGYQCDALMCVLFYEIPGESPSRAPLVGITEWTWQDAMHEAKTNNCDYWNKRCDGGFTKACNIATNLGC